MSGKLGILWLSLMVNCLSSSCKHSEVLICSLKLICSRSAIKSSEYYLDMDR